MREPEPPLHRNLVAGSWSGTARSVRLGPAGGGPVARIADADAETVRGAAEAAAAALKSWADTPPPARGRILGSAARVLDARAEEVARTIHREEGKTIAEARGEVRRGVDYLDFFAAEGWRLGGETLASEDPRQQILTFREPVGVVAAITPWNFPLAIPAWKVAPALVAGCTVVLKPAASAAGPAVALVEALVEAGIPDGVVDLVHGDDPAVGQALVDHPAIDALSFTGSNRVGRSIAERLAGRPVRLQLELGGLNHLVVLADAELEVAVELALSGAFGQTGQACTATRRILCERGIYDAFTAALADGASRLNGTVDALGPLVSTGAAASVAAAAADAVDAGARAIAGGYAHDARMAATILADVPAHSPLLAEEVFGPLVSVTPVDDLEEAIAIVNASRYGLAAAIATRSLPSALEFARRADVGTVKVNRTTTGNQPNVPFGGVKESSNGFYREQGREALEFFTRTKSVYLGW